MNHRELNSKFYHLFSGPERIPAGAAFGRAAATFRIIPAPLPGADIRAPEIRSHLLPAGSRQSYSTCLTIRDSPANPAD